MNAKNRISVIVILSVIGIAPVLSSADLTWRGTVPNWFGATAWRDSDGAAAAFSANDNIWLTDDGLGNSAFTGISSAISLGTMTVSNSTGNYALSLNGGSLTGAALVKTNSGTLTFGQTGAVKFATTDLQGGTLVIRQTAFDGGAITISGTVTLNAFTAATTTLGGTSLSGAGDFTLNPNGGSRIQLAGTLDTSSFTGTIRASESGQVNIQGSSMNLAQARVVLSGDTLFQGLSNGTLSIGEITAGTQNILGKGISSATATIYEIGALNTDSSIAGVIQNGGITTAGNVASGTVGLTKVGSGSLSLTGTNTYTGATTVNAGSLLLGNGSSGSLGSTSTTVNSGEFFGNLSSGNITSGSVTIGNNSGSSDALFGAGRNSIGRFASSSSLALNSDALFVFDLHSGSQLSDSLLFGSSVVLNGLFSLIDLNTGLSRWNLNDSFTVLSGASITGSFINLADGDSITKNGVTYTASYSSNSLTLTVTAIPEPQQGILLLSGLALLLWRRVRSH